MINGKMLKTETQRTAGAIIFYQVTLPILLLYTFTIKFDLIWIMPCILVLYLLTFKWLLILWMNIKAIDLINR